MSQNHITHLREEEQRNRLLSVKQGTRRSMATTSQLDDLTYLHQEGQALQRSHRVVDELIELGSTIKSTLMQQRITLKAIRRKVLDLATTLGVSHSVIRMIEQRNFIDKIIVYTGMIFTLLLLAFLVYYFRI